MLFNKISEKELDDNVTKIKNKIEDLFTDNNKIFATSSFQSQSLPLLHILSEINLHVKIYFTDTGFLFPETYDYVDKITKLFNLDVEILKSDIPKIRQLDRNGSFLYASDPDYCCEINKVQPLEKILIKNDIWINGVRKDQSSFRANLREKQNAKHNCLRFHPMLNWNSKMIYYYNKYKGLPLHPLENNGYNSIGCEPCTTKYICDEHNRNSRWNGINKTECGLNTDLLGESK